MPEEVIKRKRGRPRKNPLQEVKVTVELSVVDDVVEDEPTSTQHTYLVTAFTVQPDNPREEEPDIRYETEAHSGPDASMKMMRHYGRKSYFYPRYVDTTPVIPRRRRRHLHED
jgi:glycerol-3-phosphate cytidylyltransferase-like family protein